MGLVVSQSREFGEFGNVLGEDEARSHIFSFYGYRTKTEKKKKLGLIYT